MTATNPARFAFLLCLGACASTSDVAPAPTPAPAPAPAATDAGDTLPAAPVARRSDHVDTYHDVEVADPYRWMEDLDAPEVAEWVAGQNLRTRAFLDRIPERPAIAQRLAELWDYEKRGVPDQRGERLFYMRNTGLQPQSVLWVQDGPDAAPRVLIDPNTWSTDGTVALNRRWPTDDGTLLAYGVSEAGSDWQSIRILNVATGADLPDKLQWIKFSGAAWTPDNDGFYYSRYPEPEPGKALGTKLSDQKLYYHRIGTDQSQDTLIYERPDEPTWGFGAWVTEDGAWLTIHVWRGSEPRNLVFVRDLRNPEDAIHELIGGWDGRYDLLGNDGDVFYVFTDLDAPRGRIVAVDANAPAREHWQTIVPESDATLESVSLLGDRFICQYLRDARTEVLLIDTAGQPVGTVALPGIGSAGGFGGLRTATTTYYSFTSYTTPPEIHRLTVATGTSERIWRAEVPVDTTPYTVSQVFYHSKDGTRVPMFLVHRSDLERTGDHPTYLYGYGGFNNSLTPWFSPSWMVWLERGGVIAVANLRGGGEYGREWHQAGTKLRKQNVFDDFIAAAEYLIAERYTRASALAIAGGSNGGLLVGACLLQRPDLFGACLPAVGVMDMLRYESFTIGWAWAGDYGSVKNADEFRALLAYSPVHNCRPGTRYPPTLITTADHDDRVWPAHSFKFAAALQHAHAGDAPVLIRVETRAGHGAGKPTAKRIAEAADQWAFLTAVLK